MSDNDAQTISALQSQIASLQSKLASLDRYAQDLATRNTSLIQENKRIAEKAAKENEALRSEVKDLRLKNARLVESIKLANMRYFGSKSERVIPDQLSLFNDVCVATHTSFYVATNIMRSWLVGACTGDTFSCFNFT